MKETRIKVILGVLLMLYLIKDTSTTLQTAPGELAKKLAELAINGLGTSEMQGYYDKLTFKSLDLNGNSILNDLATRFANKLQTKVTIARKIKDAVEVSYAKSATVTSRTECCKADTRWLKYDSRFRTKVNLDEMCVIISGAASSNPKQLQDNVLQTMKQNIENNPTLTWQYFGSEEGLYTNYPMIRDSSSCSSYDPRYRPWYVEAASPQPKDVILVVDYSGSMGGSRLPIAKEAAKTVLDTLNPRDRVAFLAFESGVRRVKVTSGDAKDEKCFESSLAKASPVNIDILKKFLDGEYASGGTMYAVAFNAAFDILDKYYKEKNTTRRPVILFMTDGAPNDDPGTILNTVKMRNQGLSTKADILTFGMGGGISPAGVDLLQSLAEQTIDGGAVGRYTPVTDVSNLRNRMATYYSAFSRKEDDKPIFSVPYVDTLGLGLLTSITFPCYHQGKFIGVAGTDVVMSELLADVTYFNQGQASYAFVADSSGRTMMHPLLPKPSDPYQAPFFLDIRDLEPEGNFSDIIFSGIKSQTPGSLFLTSSRFLARGGSIYDGVTTKAIPSMYYWKPIPDTNFTLGIVVKKDVKNYITDAVKKPEGFKFVYHRLDLSLPTTTCQYFSRYGVKDKAIVKFGPQAFKNPYEYLGNEETDKTVAEYVKYFDGGTSEKFKESIRNTVYVTQMAETIWGKSNTGLSQYVVWRYIGTRDGVFRMMPGAALPKNFDATTRPWYISAQSNIDKLALSKPYVDAAGAGLVITAAQTIFKVRENQHATADDVIAVMGADFPLPYFKKILGDTYPLCKSSSYTCFVMDRSGFLIYHDTFMTSSITARDLNLAHVTDKEKLVAQDMIQRGLLERKHCRNMASIKTVNFYDVRVTTGVDYTATYLSCSANYNIFPISGSNAFLGLVRKTGSCYSNGALCSCSSDKERMCSYISPDCQCPCSSTLDFNYCDSEYPLSNVSICAVPAEALLTSEEKQACVPRDLQKCYDPKCSEKTTEGACEGVVGCSWCVRDGDGASLSNPFCSPIDECFAGTKGAKSPGAGEGNYCKSSGSSGLSGGAIAGIIIAVIIVLITIIVGVVLYKKIHKKKPSARPKPADVSSAPPIQPAVDFKPGVAPPTVNANAPYPPYNQQAAPPYPAYNPQYLPPGEYNPGYQ
ncbi:VWFA and cache domain-containing protein 1 [Nematostella vectensis]|uniref:VWFA and cache domain-containing protein 1 n=1 Tax=Nematostella vectensis TaxID=45351 RepID=UPI002076FF29|nr:VWFA and cache domain-containing protein 1 [Nematostella vectensis]